MPILLGIDTGGTYTDAVLLDEAKGILAKAKSPTTDEDLTIGIRNAVQKLFTHTKPHIHLVSLSSTLATNAVVEGKGSPAGLILIGYDPDILNSDAFEKIRSENPVISIRGGHGISGDEQAPLDKKSLKQAINAHADSVSAFAVSGYFGVRNPSHELSAKALIREMTGLPVTCGHELTTSLDAPRRAQTALLNARLIPLIYKLILSVKRVLADFEIHAPLMIVKGDGSLISSDLALDIPVETILSGPAASVVGARYLTGFQDAVIIDMGGTTSDVAMLKDGSVLISEDRTSVGGFHPMIQSIDMLTEGIGGDSWIRTNRNGSLKIGPMRVIPLCVLGSRHPDIIRMMENSMPQSRETDLPMFILKDASEISRKNITSICRELIDRLAEAPLFIPQFLEQVKYPSIYAQNIEYLLKEGLVNASSFTPTDAVNVLGYYQTGSMEAARIGAGLIASRIKMDVETFCKMTVDQVQYDLAFAIVRCALRADDASGKISEQPAGSFFIDRALRKNLKNLINCSMSLSCPIVAVGAPAGTYLPKAASLLSCDISVPENAAVANAIGAVTGVISQAVHILIKPLHGGMSFRVHTPEGIAGFAKYKDAEKFAYETAAKIAGERARTAGAEKIEIDLAKKNVGIKDSDSGEESETLVQTKITAIAVGRPRMGV